MRIIADDLAAIEPLAVNMCLADCGVGGIMSENDFTELCTAMSGQSFRFKVVDGAAVPSRVRMFTEEREVVVDHTTMVAVVNDAERRSKVTTGNYDDACEEANV